MQWYALNAINPQPATWTATCYLARPDRSMHWIQVVTSDQVAGRATWYGRDIDPLPDLWLPKGYFAPMERVRKWIDCIKSNGDRLYSRTHTSRFDRHNVLRPPPADLTPQ